MGTEIEIAATGDNKGHDAASWYLTGEADLGEGLVARFPDIAVAPNGDVYVAWFEFAGQGPYSGMIPIRRSTDGGNSFGEVNTAGDDVDLGVCFVGNARPQIRPSLAASPNGSLFMVTCDRKTVQDPDPYLRLFRSEDNGSSWTETWTLRSAQGKQDFFPNVVVTPNERVHVSFMHSAAGQSCAYGTNSASMWLATSDDNGLSFSDPKQVSSEFSLNSGEMAYFEAYATPGFTDDAVFPVWTDHRENHPVPYFASMLTANVGVPNGWAMSGIPHFMNYYTKENVYPGVNPSNIYYYAGSSGYVVAPEPLRDDIGYWVRFPTAGTHRFLGTWKDEMPMTVQTAWNIIGSISSPVSTADIIQNPTGIVISSYFDDTNDLSPFLNQVRDTGSR